MTEEDSSLSPSSEYSGSDSRDLFEARTDRSEDRFRTTFESAAVGMAQVAPDGRLLAVNKRLCEITRFSREELTARTFQDITHPEDLATGLMQVRRMLAGEIANYSLEKRYIRKDCSPVWINLSVTGVRNPNGSISYFIAVVEDITKRKEAEAHLKDSENRLRQILNNLVAFVAVITLDGVLAEVNDAPLDISGLSRSAVIGKPIWDCEWWNFSEKAQERLRKAFRRALAGETVRYDTEMRTRGNQYITVDFQLAPLKNAFGNVVEVIFSGTDITSRRLVAARLRGSEANLQLAQDAANLGRWSWNLATQQLSWTDRCRALFGLSAGANINSSLFLAAIHPEDRERVVRAVSTAIVQGTDYDVEMRTVWPDGSVHWIASKGRVYFDEGQPASMVGVAFDITARKQAEEQMTYALQEVDHRAKNLLSVVQAIVRQTARTETADEFVTLFSERIRGLAASHDLLVGNRWQGVALIELIRSQLAHFQDALGSRVRLEGPPIELNAMAAQTIGMVIHELATNACKYGALSNENGYVLVNWSIDQNQADSVFTITWSEHSGPLVMKPTRRGFGQTVLVRMAEDALDGEVRLDYDPDGLRWRVRCDARNALKS